MTDTMTHAVAIGIDLAWRDHNPTGLALLNINRRRSRMELIESSLALSDKEIIKWVLDRCAKTTLLGIDAPLIAPNSPGTSRPCDKEISRKFWQSHAGAYPANEEKCARSIRLCKQLEALGFNANPNIGQKKRGWWQLEVFPHPAQVVLFQLSQIIKYKKGSVAKRRSGLGQLADHIQRFLPRLTPKLLTNDVLVRLCEIQSGICGRPLKDREDQLDAVICGYTASYHWWWGKSRSEIVGDSTYGYIVCPRADVGHHIHG